MVVVHLYFAKLRRSWRRKSKDDVDGLRVEGDKPFKVRFFFSTRSSGQWETL
jgi:hypothetical protein